MYHTAPTYHLFKSRLIVVNTCLTLISSFLLFQMHVNAENILIIFIFGNLIIILFMRNYFWGVLSTFTYMTIFNFFYIKPYFTFTILDKNALISCSIFLIISLLIMLLTIKLQKQNDLSGRIQYATDRLFQISTDYMYVQGMDQVIEYGIHNLKFVYNSDYFIHINLLKGNQNLWYGMDTLDSQIKDAAKQYLQSGEGLTQTNAIYMNHGWAFFPLHNNTRVFGVASVRILEKSLSEDNYKSIKAILSLIAVSIAREYAYQEKQESLLLTEREKLKNNLLRSISHDLKTPLAGITGSASLLLESHQDLDKKSMLLLLTDILDDSIWLENLVENLLQMTKLQEGKSLIKNEYEVVDDIISESLSKVQKRLRQRKLIIALPEDMLLIPIDGQLIIQVLINIFDNAIKHTKPNGIIQVTITTDSEFAYFEIKDNGTGIEASILDTMFDSFITSDLQQTDASRGVGLGLNICRSIIHAHKGTIKAQNNTDSGASILFTLPLAKEQNTYEL